MNQWTDIHAHLNMLEHKPEEACELALKNGVKRFITIATCPDDHELVFQLAQDFAPQVYCTQGVHPHDAKTYSDEVEASMEGRLSHPRVVAVAEIGLDYHYDYSPRDQQNEAFRRQMSLAEKHSLPVQIHTREAEADTHEVLKSFQGRVRGLLHCFTSSMDLAKKALDCGFNISFSGIVTFKNADDLREVVKMVPMDRLHVETDSPFLTPVPFRGTKNHPANVVHVAEKVAELKGVSLEELAAQTQKNAQDMFQKIQWEE